MKIALISSFRTCSPSEVLCNPEQGLESSSWRGWGCLRGAAACRGQGRSAGAAPGCEVVRAFSFWAVVCAGPSCSSPAGKRWKCVMKSVCKLSLSLKGIRNINGTEKLAFEVASYSSSNTCKGSVKLSEGKSNLFRACTIISSPRRLLFAFKQSSVSVDNTGCVTWASLAAKHGFVMRSQNKT